MKTVTVNLNNIEKVKTFCNKVSKFPNDISLISGRYVIDAKSIMGIFSLDLSKNLEMRIEDGDTYENEILKELSEYIVK